MSEKVLVIDDSALMRKHIRQILESQGFDVETARNGQEGLEKIKSYDPSVVSLDINMPVMDGITCLSHIMTEAPRPVVMVSSLTEKGALATFEALELGAVDYVAKPGGTVSLNIKEVSDELVGKIAQAAKARVGSQSSLRNRLRIQREKAEVEPTRPKSRINKHASDAPELILVGVSTGGPGTVEKIVDRLPTDFGVPIVIAQHMPERFTQVFAERLNRSSPLTVIEVTRPVRLEAGHVYIAKGDNDIKIITRAGRLMASSVPPSTEHVWHPSVERLVESAMTLVDPKKLICVQLTGMGNDGAYAMTKAHKAGAKTIAESEATAVVYGMPKELVAQGGAQEVLPNNRIADQLLKWAY